MTNKFQYQIAKEIISEKYIWSLIFEFYLRFVICDLLFGNDSKI